MISSNRPPAERLLGRRSHNRWCDRWCAGLKAGAVPRPECGRSAAGEYAAMTFQPRRAIVTAVIDESVDSGMLTGPRAGSQIATDDWRTV